MTKLVQVCPDVDVDPDEVVAVEKNDRFDNGDWSEGPRWLGHGTVMTLRNGRKIFVEMEKSEVMKRLNSCG